MKTRGHVPQLERGSEAQVQPMGTAQDSRQITPAPLVQERREIPTATGSLPSVFKILAANLFH